MKRIAQIFLMAMIAGMLAGCGKDTIQESGADVESSVTDEANIKTEESVETEIQDSETQNQNSHDVEDVALAISVEELSDKYTDCIDNIVKDCDTLEELAFATVDVNNDGIRELLYAESNVNAAGVYVCFYSNGQIITTGPFGCYGGIKYVPAEGKIISIMDNMDYMKYELVGIDEKYETDVEQKFEIEPTSDGSSYVFFLNDEEVTEREYSNAFSRLKNMDVRCLDYDDMFMYNWTTADPDIIAQHLTKLLEEDEASREYHMIIPMEEKAKLIGTGEMYSSEIEGEISYAKDGDVSGKGEGETLVSVWDIYNRTK